ncbi:MAG: hypothetical protein PHH16_03980 [Candidatus Gracilibacteria bacterium]|nr:hypothetical protein [Candidatus Gracilibacteria bacterium]
MAQYEGRITDGPSLMKMMMCVNKDGDLTTEDRMDFIIAAPNGMRAVVSTWVQGYERVDEDGKKFRITASGVWGGSEKQRICNFSGVYDTRNRKGDDIIIEVNPPWW